MKRAADLAGSTAGLLILSPLLCLVAALVFLTDFGPVFFRQKRTGLNGEVFEIYKFRSMRLRPVNTPFEQTKGRYDPRITWVGRWMRATSVDELPQLVNVMRGEMSLVGPRPHPVELDQEYSTLISGYDARFDVVPGLTGVAQVSGARGPIEKIEDMQRRYNLDRYYIENWSLKLDMQIIFKTVFSRKTWQNAV
jgi:lipopolysaccharide/colanic/teichoic acid biosynthesis glycosyltransferase